MTQLTVAGMEILDPRLVLSSVGLSLQHTNLSVEESRPAHNFGYATSDTATVTTVTANVGAVTFQAQWGLWQWDFLSSDGAAESQDVTITAADDTGATSSVTFHLDVTNVAPTITLHTPAETQHQGVAFPLGDLSFADEVSDFSPGPNTTFLDPTKSLGVPQGGDNSLGVTLGNGGSLTLRFTDNALVDQSLVADGVDLYVFDLGNDSEEVTIEISTDGLSWIALPAPVSMRAAEATGIDIAAIATPGAEYHFVRITDVFLAGEYDPSYVGPDIDAVGVVGRVPRVVVNGGQTALHSGAFSDPGTDVVSITTSLGTVTQTGTQAGEWAWSLPTFASASGTHLVTITATDNDGGVSTASFELLCIPSTPTIVDVAINVRPFNDRNLINLNSVSDRRDHNSNKFIPVVVYTTSSFNARNIDLSTVVFAGAHVAKYSYCDVDGDGDKDLVAFFKLRETNLYSAYRELLQTNSSRPYRRDFEVTLSGETRDGVQFEGTDVVRLFTSGRALRELLDSL